MKTLSLLAACALVAATAACASSHDDYAAQSKAKESKAAASKQDAKMAEPMDEAKMMELWAAAGALGPEHEAFAQDVGQWNLALTAYMDPSAPPQTYTSTATIELALGGRYLVEKVKGDMGDFGPFEGLGVLGFNNITKQYTHVWMDSMSTGSMHSTGTATADGTVTMTGSYDDAMTGGKTKVRTVTKHTGPDSRTFTMYEDREQGEMKSMEIVYTRAR